MKVRVQDTGAEHFVGFHDYARRRPGDVFEIPNTPRRLPSDSEKKIIESTAKAKADYDQIKDEGGRIPQLYSFRWMEPAPGERESVTTSQQALDRKSADIKLEKAASKTADVI